MMENNDRIYFNPGELVTIRQDIPYKPTMIVVRKEKTIFKKDDNEGILKGIRCRWFSKDGQLQEAVWNTKDLIKID